MGEGDEEEKLKNATLNSLRVAEQNHLKSISFPAISSGIFGFPVDRCAKIMLSNTISYLQGDTTLKKVVFCLYGKDNFAVFQKELEKQLPD